MSNGRRRPKSLSPRGLTTGSREEYVARDPAIKSRDDENGMNAEIITLKNDLHNLMQGIGRDARAAYRVLAESGSKQRNLALKEAAKAIRKAKARILDANRRDVSAARKVGITRVLLERLELNPARVEAMAKGLENIARLPDPLGKTLASFKRPNGLTIDRVSVPLGVIGIIYESRPNVTADAGGLCLKSGNAVILRGGSDGFLSSQAIVACLHKGLKAAKLPKDAIQLVPTKDRAAVGEMITMTGLIDIIVPRGGKSLTARILTESRVPTLQHLDGNCHTYIHAKADVKMARDVLYNAKMRRCGVCGATESLVIDRALLKALPNILDPLFRDGCEVRGDKDARKADARIKPATEADWETEYLDAILSVKTVSGVEDAVAHINPLRIAPHGFHHHQGQESR